MFTEQKPTCFPECGSWLAQRLNAFRSPQPVQAGLYDVAVWRSSHDLPILADEVVASSGFQAIEQVMCSHHMRFCDRASAVPSGGSWFQIYRFFRVELPRRSQKESEVSHG